MEFSEEKKCVIIKAEDLQDDNLRRTIGQINANPDKFYLLSADWSNAELCYIIDKLSKASDDDTMLTKTRFAYNMNFNLHTILQTGNTNSSTEIEVKSLDELLEKLEYDENLILTRDDYHVIIDDDEQQSNDNSDEASATVAKLFQQTIFLNLNLDVKKKSEIKKALIKDRFRSNYKNLRQEIDKQIKYLEAAIEHGNLSDEGKARVENMLNSFKIMTKETEKAKERPIRIAAMGTKKAGKSVVINSILKCDYAPTSSELPTPNTIKYIPYGPENPFKLVYAENEFTFNNAEELHNFILDEFERAKAGKPKRPKDATDAEYNKMVEDSKTERTGYIEKKFRTLAKNNTPENLTKFMNEIKQKEGEDWHGLPDMVIYYPCDDLNGYEVWDTPGPNVAFTDEHRKNAEDCIKQVDVCIFVMNYSTHLTNDEVNFLQQIKDVFKDNNKFYSLFITVNRIDERYAATVEKSVNRIIDYIIGKLDEMDYKNIVTFATSALQSFYLDKIRQMVDSDEAIDEITIKKLIKEPKYKKYKTQLSFIRTSLNQLEEFHDIDEPTDKVLETFSGIPQLWRYVKYIGEQKADMEIVDKVVSQCDMQFATINNALLITELLNLSEEDKKYLVELGELIKGLSNVVTESINKIQPLIDEDKLHAAWYLVNKDVESSKNDVLKSAKDRSRNILNNSDLDEDDVKQMKDKKSSERMKELNANISQMILGLNKQSVEKLDKVVKDIGITHIQKVEKGIQNAQEKIENATEEVKLKVKNSNASNSVLESFKTPQFPASLDKVTASSEFFNLNIENNTLSQIAENAKRTEYETRYRTEHKTEYRTETREREARGFWETIKFWKTYYEDVEVPYTVSFEVPYQVPYDVYDVDAFKSNIINELQNRVTEKVEAAHKLMENEMKKSLEIIYNDVKEQCGNIESSYQKLFNDFNSDIDSAINETSEHKQAMEHDISMLEDMKKELQTFFNMWNDILHGDVKQV